MTQKDEALKMAIAWIESDWKPTNKETVIQACKAALSEPEQLDINPNDGHYQLVTIGESEQVSPPKREWVGLSDEQINECWDIGKGKFTDIAKAIEAKLKEVNGYA